MDTRTRRMDSFGSEDMALPELKLVQFVGGEEAKSMGAKPGDLYCSLTNTVYPEGLNIIVVDMQKTRTYWGRSEISDEPPHCASLDADSMLNITGESCQECPNRVDVPWLIDVSERRDKCLLNYNVLAIDPETSMPLIIRASGISTKPVRELLTQLRMNKTLKGEYHRALIRVTSIKQKRPSGEAFAFQFKLAGLLTDLKKVEEMALLSNNLLGVTIGLPEVKEPIAIPAPAKMVSDYGEPLVTSTASAESETSEKKIKEPKVDINF